jgi:hypothetical protein
MNSELVTCSSCGREWDGNAQCNCYQDMYLSLSDSDREDQVFTPSPRKTEPLMKDASTQTEEKEKIILTPLEKAQKAVDERFKHTITRYRPERARNCLTLS